MEIDEALTARANGDPALAGLVDTNIHWVLRPQGAPLPALVMQTIDQQHDEDLDGTEAMRVARVQLDGLAKTKEAADTVVNAAIAALQPEAEVAGSDGGVAFWRAGLEGPHDLGDQTDEGFIHRSSADLIIRYAKVA